MTEPIKPPGRLVEVDFRRGQSDEGGAALESEGDPLPVLDLVARLQPKSIAPTRDGCLTWEVTDGNVQIVVRRKGKLRYAWGCDNEAMRKWAQNIVNACRETERTKAAIAIAEQWAKVVRGDLCDPPKASDWHRQALLERVAKSTALAVARSLWRFDLEDRQAIAIAEELTGRKMAAGSDPRTAGPQFEIGREDGILLVTRWREQLAVKGLTPMALSIRDKSAEVALMEARRQQCESGVRCFRYQRRKACVDVWLWQGGYGQRLTNWHADKPHPRTQSDAIAWAKAYAARHGFAYLEAI